MKFLIDFYFYGIIISSISINTVLISNDKWVDTILLRA